MLHPPHEEKSPHNHYLSCTKLEVCACLKYLFHAPSLLPEVFLFLSIRCYCFCVFLFQLNPGGATSKIHILPHHYCDRYYFYFNFIKRISKLGHGPLVKQVLVNVHYNSQTSKYSAPVKVACVQTSRREIP